MQMQTLKPLYNDNGSRKLLILFELHLFTINKQLKYIFNGCFVEQKEVSSYFISTKKIIANQN